MNMNPIQHSLKVVTLGLSLTAVTMSAWSQQTARPGAMRPGTMGKGPAMGRGQMAGRPGGVSRVAKDLGLTPQQQARIQKVAESTMAQNRAVQANTKLKPEQKRAKFIQNMTVMRSNLNAILTPAQRKKVEAMRQQRMKQMGAMRSAPGAKR